MTKENLVKLVNEYAKKDKKAYDDLLKKYPYLKDEIKEVEEPLAEVKKEEKIDSKKKKSKAY